MTAIECKDLWLSYGSASVIEGLSFSLEKGKCLAFAFFILQFSMKYDII
jgi:ABC-type multidrug transport system ATPase subunit